jgi:hypothetical protein
VRHKHRLVNNIKLELNGIEYGVVEWIKLAQDGIRHLDLVSTVVKLCISVKNF